MDGRMDGRMDRWIERGQVCGCLERYLMSVDGMIYLAEKEEEGEEEAEG